MFLLLYLPIDPQQCEQQQSAGERGGLTGFMLLAVDWEGGEVPRSPLGLRGVRLGRVAVKFLQVVVGQPPLPIGGCAAFKFSL